jgi:hypothetical protein
MSAKRTQGPLPRPCSRPTCAVCKRYADRKRDVKGRFYLACAVCGYDSRTGVVPPMTFAEAGRGGRSHAETGDTD